MDMAGLQKAREGIISHIQGNGPSLPAAIASSLKIPLLFISAFLSELYREQKLLMSHMKIGTSSLYLLPGQEKQLENFAEHLNQREREAFNIIKSRQVVKDPELSPVHRVAMREIKDFALPVQKDSEIFWHYAFAPAQVQISQPISAPTRQVEPDGQEMPLQVVEAAKPKARKPRMKKQDSSHASAPFSLSLSAVEQSSPFADEVRILLERSGYSSISLVKADKKEASFKASIPGPHGVQSYLVIAKDKKRIKEDELSSALQEAHNQRMLCLVMARADMDKKAQSFISSWANFISYRSF